MSKDQLERFFQWKVSQLRMKMKTAIKSHGYSKALEYKSAIKHITELWTLINEESEL